MIPIKDIDEYNARMRQAMLDKLWWLDKVGDNVRKVVDYGCADGALLQEVHSMDASWMLFGYDFNEDMVALAKENVPTGVFSTDFSELSGTADCENAVLVASSVFHEIHNYSSDVEGEYRQIFGSGYQYIAIRDMFISEKQFGFSDPDPLAKVREKSPAKWIEDFETFMGPIDRRENLLQFLLTYPYQTNWDREVRENYFPHTVEQFLARIPKCYEVVHFEHYTLPFVKEKVHQDFGIELQDETHAKILLRHQNR